MTIAVTDLFRYPIKSHGRERLTSVHLNAGQSMPWDRVWGIAHDSAKMTPGSEGWAACQNFSRGSKAPMLAAINATVDESTGTVTLTHPDQPTITVNPDDATDAAKLVSWSNALLPSNRAQSALW